MAEKRQPYLTKRKRAELYRELSEEEIKLIEGPVKHSRKPGSKNCHEPGCNHEQTNETGYCEYHYRIHKTGTWPPKYDMKPREARESLRMINKAHKDYNG